MNITDSPFFRLSQVAVNKVQSFFKDTKNRITKVSPSISERNDEININEIIKPIKRNIKKEEN
ncbi:MAG: hypothetical protein KA536_00165 [Saprospiraceae bacterium]|nr:hypothetical protein [Saprospiraceae bacterium]